MLGLTDAARVHAGREGSAVVLDQLLGTNGLIILGQTNNQFQFIHCDGGEDAEVCCFNAYRKEQLVLYPSVVDWLAAACEAALRPQAMIYEL